MQLIRTEPPRRIRPAGQRKSVCRIAAEHSAAVYREESREKLR